MGLEASLDELNALIAKNLERGARQTLLGSESFEIASGLGIEVAPFSVVVDVKEAVRAAEELHYPVVLKIVSPSAIHKSELGGVITGIKSSEELKHAFHKLMERFHSLSPHAVVSGVLVQSQVSGVEVVVGATRDKTFGPVVIVGLGGIWVELMHDVSIGLCPITREKALEMIEGLKGYKLLDGFRGSQKSDIESVVQAMLTVSQVMERIPNITEFEINPLIVGPIGNSAIAADVRISISQTEIEQPEKLSGESFKHLFEAESIAVVGGSTDYTKVGGRIVSRIKNHGYRGKLVVVNPREAAAPSSTIPAYQSINSIPFDIEAALVVISAEATADVVQECVKKGVKIVAVYATGFGEKEDELGEDRQERLVRAVKSSNGQLRLVGPNILGLIRPSSNLHAEFTSYEGEMKPGHIGFVTQSGGIGSSLVTEAVERGMDVSALISTGNETDLDAADGIDYLVRDQETKVIVCYLENVSDGQKLKMAASKALDAGKPIIIYKSGISNLGKSLAKSHTGAIAVDDSVFDAFVREYGITRVQNLYDAIEFAKAFSLQPLPKGNRLGIVSGSGGANVIISDVLSDKDVLIPEFPFEMRGKLRALFPDTVVKNPVDYSSAIVSAPKLIGELIDTILREGDIDSLIVIVTTFAEVQGRIVSEAIVNSKKYGKPILVVWPFPRSAIGKHVSYLQKENSIPVYLSVEDAAKSLAAMLDYSKALSRKKRAVQ